MGPSARNREVLHSGSVTMAFTVLGLSTTSEDEGVEVARLEGEWVRDDDAAAERDSSATEGGAVTEALLLPLLELDVVGAGLEVGMGVLVSVGVADALFVSLTVAEAEEERVVLSVGLGETVDGGVAARVPVGVPLCDALGVRVRELLDVPE